jgi:vacuolar protein sorting-associated protein 26
VRFCDLLDDIIPVRMYLHNYDLTPSYENVNNKFRVQYYLSLVLVD